MMENSRPVNMDKSNEMFHDINNELIDCSDLSLTSYEKFINSKLSTNYVVKGRVIKTQIYQNDINVDDIETENHLFDYQRFIVKTALKKMRYAVFADCGLGKTAIFLSWARHLGKHTTKKILIVSPLSVIKQTISEEEKFYGESTIENLHKKSLSEWLCDDSRSRIGIINYDAFHETKDINNRLFGIILDESSILKNATGATSTALINTFRGVPYKLCCTATPAPNDREEYASHSTFLGYTRSNREFLAKYFVNRENGWDIKPHSLQHFYRELSEWSIFLRSPDAYGFDSNVKDIPEPTIDVIPIAWTDQQRKLFKTNAFSGHPDELLAKKHYFLRLSKGIHYENAKTAYVENEKINVIKKLIFEHPKEKVIVWCIYNEEEKMLHDMLYAAGIKTVVISGDSDEEQRYEKLKEYQNNPELNVLITKSKILGFGINLQQSSVHIFSGMSDSYEQFYQAIRRSYRYGQKRQLHVYIPVTDAEQTILDNVLSKKNLIEIDAKNQEGCFISNLKDDVARYKNVGGNPKMTKMVQQTDRYEDDNCTLIRDDSIVALESIKDNSVDLSVFSPPFASLFTYSGEIQDMGNNRDSMDEFKLHYEFFLNRLFRVTKPGRIVCCHLSQLATFKSLEGFVGTKDFRGDIIDLFEKAGFIFFGEWCIKKNPQMQAIKEKVRSLSFAQLERNRLGSRAGFNDYIVVFKKPGETSDTVDSKDGPTREEWINWACGVWGDINESDTLNTRSAKSEDDVKHICPLNMEVVRRCIRMYSNKGDTILDPFNGIGTTIVTAISLGRKGIGIELKQEYFDESVHNVKRCKSLNVSQTNEKITRKILNTVDYKSSSLW